MFPNSKLTQYLFLDIETVPLVYNFDELSQQEKKLFEKKVKYRINNETTLKDLYQQAGIWAEFGKIIVISTGYFAKEDGSEFRIKSFASHNETEILQNFAALLNSKYFQKKSLQLCAHNGKEFDFPYIARRMLINQIPLSSQLTVFGKKPWETSFCDTMELWRFGDYKHYTSLELLTHILNIPSPKTDIEGKDVAFIYYEQNDLEHIKEYCENDVIAVVQIMLRYMGRELLKSEKIVKR